MSRCARTRRRPAALNNARLQYLYTTTSIEKARERKSEPVTITIRESDRRGED